MMEIFRAGEQVNVATCVPKSTPSSHWTHIALQGVGCWPALLPSSMGRGWIPESRAGEAVSVCTAVWPLSLVLMRTSGSFLHPPGTIPTVLSVPFPLEEPKAFRWPLKGSGFSGCPQCPGSRSFYPGLSDCICYCRSLESRDRATRASSWKLSSRNISCKVPRVAAARGVL